MSFTSAHVTGVVLVLSTIFAASEAEACTGASPTRYAASAALNDVNSCITAASSGDTILVPAGSATWTTAITLPSTKDLSIVGSGIDVTNITCTDRCLTIPNSSTYDISGFSFTYGGNIAILSRIDAPKPGKYHRIHHNKISRLNGWGEVNITGEPTTNCNGTTQVHPTALYDNNQFINTRVLIIGTACSIGDGSAQHRLWSQDPRPNAPTGAWPGIVYVEDNKFHSTSGLINYIDSNYGGRYVSRFNTLSAASGQNRPYAEVHGVQAGNRAVQWIEIYKNDATATGNDNFFGHLFMRAGSGVIWGLRSPSSSQVMRLNNMRSCEAVSTAGQCDGTNSNGWDGNTVGASGYPCRDQIGRYRDTSFWTPGSAYTGQDFAPVYFWDNIKGASTQDVPTWHPAECSALQNHVRQNRDWYTQDAAFKGATGIGVGTLSSRPSSCTPGVAYWATDQGEWNSRNPGPDGQLYRCTTPNTWSLYYTPYTYPHPLQGAAGGGTPPPATVAPPSALTTVVK